MSTTIDASKTVGELVREQPGLTRIFENLGIDYCCGGKRPLEEACERKGLDAATIVQTLSAVVEAQSDATGGGTDWARASFKELCDHIEQTHHRYLIKELPRLGALVDKVAAVHGDAHPSLRQVKDVFIGLSQELLSHMQKEEQILFPLIRALEKEGASAPLGSVSSPIRRMEEEHEASGDALETLRRLTGDYTPPSDACGSYRAMLSGLEELEADLHQHIHKENNILFPRAMEEEQSRR